MLPEQFAILGAVISFIAMGIYAFATIRGKAKPNRITFFIWALAPLIAFFAQISKGVGLQSLLTFSIGFGPVVILAASFLHRGAPWKLTRFDYTCGVLAIIGLILWQITQEGVIAIFFSLLADIFASIPTIVKSYNAPHTESAYPYLLTGIGGIVTILTVTNWNFETAAFPIYIILLNGIIFSILRLRTASVVQHS